MPFDPDKLTQELEDRLGDLHKWIEELIDAAEREIEEHVGDEQPMVLTVEQLEQALAEARATHGGIVRFAVADDEPPTKVGDRSFEVFVAHARHWTPGRHVFPSGGTPSQ